MLFHKIAEISPLPDLRLLVRFMSGEVKQYSLKPMLERHETFQDLINDELFRQVRVDAGGFGISWNDEIDLSCNELWEHGQNENSGKMTTCAHF